MIAVIFVIIFATNFVYKKSIVQETVDGFLGANLPDRCQLFTQIASRSIKDTIKAASGRVMQIRVTNGQAAVRYFQLFNKASAPVGANTPVYAVPVNAAASSVSHAFFEEEFNPSLNFDTGIAFAMSPNFATFASSGVDPADLTVTICYE